MARKRSVEVTHEDERGVRRKIKVEGVHAGVTKRQVESAVNCIVFGLPFPATMDFADVAEDVRRALADKNDNGPPMTNERGEIVTAKEI